ncbi:hypothetical protein ACVJH7_001342 [Bradyrhizobium elkanii]
MPGMGLRGVADLEARQEPELHRLADQRIGAGDDRLARDHRRGGGEPDQRQQQHVGHHAVERVLDRAGIGQHQRALPEIVQQQRGQHEEQPARLDRLAAEMPEIGIQRLAAGHREEHRAQRHQADGAVGQHELERVIGIDRRQHRRVVHDVDEPHYRQRGEPHHHHRTEGGRDARGARTLHREQHDQDQDRQRHHIVLEMRGGELEAFDRRQHRDRRRDHGIADEHRGADHAEREQRPAAPTDRALAERHQRQRAALAIVVGAQQQQHVFRGDDGEQRPQDQAEHAQHHDAGDRLAVRGAADRLAECVERRSSDIAEHHPDAAECQGPEAGGGLPFLSFGR